MTKRAPASLAAAAADRPRTPGPSTATTSPGFVPGTTAPQRMPLATALYMQASDGSRSDGTDTSWLSGDRYWTSA